MKLLSIHLSLAHAGGTGAMVLGAQGRPLRNLLFRLIDTNMPDSIQQVHLTVCLGYNCKIEWAHVYKFQVIYCLQEMLTLDIHLSSHDVLIPQAVLNTLSIGASLLLPPLRERTELLLSLLPQGPQSLNVLSKGQVCGNLLCYFRNCLCAHVVVLVMVIFVLSCLNTFISQKCVFTKNVVKNIWDKGWDS